MSTQNNFSVRKWIMFTVFGWLLGFILTIFLAILGDMLGLPESQFFVGITMGAGVGFMQMRILKNNIRIETNWMWSTIIGMGTSFTLFEFGHAIWSIFPAYDLQLSVVFGGLFIGLLQYRILRLHTDQAIWWIAICFVGWALAGLSVGLNELINNFFPRSVFISSLGIFMLVFGAGIVLGLISGFGLQRILKLS